MLEKQLSMSLRISLIIVAIIVIHSVSNFAGKLGLISDVFILLGLIQSIRFSTDSKVRDELIYSFNDFINIKDVERFLGSVFKFIKEESVEDSLENLISDLNIYSSEDYKLTEDEYEDEDSKLNTEPLEPLN